MSNQFMALSLDDRVSVFNSAAKIYDFQPQMIEKDIWVCWCLEKLFSRLIF